MTFVLKLAFRFLLFISTRHRLIGIHDWLMSLTSVAILFLLSISSLVYIFLFSSHPPFKPSPFEVFLAILALALVSFPAIFFVIKLRRNGITDADYSVESGTDYKQSLQLGAKGFDFLGVGASKLKQQDKEFRAAVKSTVSAEKTIRMLLVDPSAGVAVQKLEQKDDTQGYVENINGSISFIKSIAKHNPDHIKLKFYEPHEQSELKPFRLFFADGDCLVSPFVKGTGVENQGRGLPQLRITSRGWPSPASPTLYIAFSRYFEESWKSGHEEKTELDNDGASKNE